MEENTNKFILVSNSVPQQGKVSPSDQSGNVTDTFKQKFETPSEETSIETQIEAQRELQATS